MFFDLALAAGALIPGGIASVAGLVSAASSRQRSPRKRAPSSPSLAHAWITSRALTVVFGIIVTIAGLSELTGWVQHV